MWSHLANAFNSGVAAASQTMTDYTPTVVTNNLRKAKELSASVIAAATDKAIELKEHITQAPLRTFKKNIQNGEVLSIKEALRFDPLLPTQLVPDCEESEAAYSFLAFAEVEVKDEKKTSLHAMLQHSQSMAACLADNETSDDDIARIVKFRPELLVEEIKIPVNGWPTTRCPVLQYLMHKDKGNHGGNHLAIALETYKNNPNRVQLPPETITKINELFLQYWNLAQKPEHSSLKGVLKPYCSVFSVSLSSSISSSSALISSMPPPSLLAIPSHQPPLPSPKLESVELTISLSQIPPPATPIIAKRHERGGGLPISDSKDSSSVVSGSAEKEEKEKKKSDDTSSLPSQNKLSTFNLQPASPSSPPSQSNRAINKRKNFKTRNAPKVKKSFARVLDTLCTHLKITNEDNIDNSLEDKEKHSKRQSCSWFSCLKRSSSTYQELKSSLTIMRKYKDPKDKKIENTTAASELLEDFQEAFFIYYVKTRGTVWGFTGYKATYIAQADPALLLIAANIIFSETATAKPKESKTIDHLAGMTEENKTAVRTLYSTIFSHRRWSLLSWGRGQSTCANAVLEIAAAPKYKSLFSPARP